MTEKAQPDLSILSLSGYFQKHFKLCKIHRTGEEAYKALEEEYKSLCQLNRYTSYGSFRAAKTRWYAVNR